MEKPSKELLSAVLYNNRVEINSVFVSECEVEYSVFCSLNEMHGTNFNENIPDDYYVFKDNRYFDINIYELAHKIKLWVTKFRFRNDPKYNRFYQQRSGYEDKFNVSTQKRELLGYMTLIYGGLGFCETFYADTESEAIFKAGNWIIKDKIHEMYK